MRAEHKSCLGPPPETEQRPALPLRQPRQEDLVKRHLLVGGERRCRLRTGRGPVPAHPPRVAHRASIHGAMSSGRNAARASPARVLLEGRTLSIDRRRIGISYSGGGPQLAIELGCALAMVEEGIIPDVVAGVSAGAIAATAHALDPREGRGIRIAIRLLGHVRNRTLKLAWYQVLLRLVHENLRLRSLGDNPAVRDLFGQAAAELGLIDFRIGSFPPPQHPKLLV